MIPSEVSSATYPISPRAEVAREAWDAFVDASDEAWLWHRYDLQDAIATWGKKDLSFAVRDGGGNILAVVPLHLLEGKTLKLVRWNVLDSLGGPATRNGLTRKEKTKLLAAVQQQVLELARRHAAGEINLALCAMAPGHRGERCPRVNPLIHWGCQNTLTQTWVVDLRPGKDAVWSGMETRARNAVRKAEGQGVQVRLADRPGDLDVYYALHCETYQRTGVRPHPKAYFAAIWHDFLAHDLSCILFAEHDGAVVAAENFGFYKQAAIYWTGASSAQGLTVQASSLLQWTAMRRMIEQGIEWYETGEAFPGAGGGKLKGLNDFKKSFGGTLYPVYRGRIITRPKTHHVAAGVRALRGRA